jgi:hypothetical protein
MNPVEDAIRKEGTDPSVVFVFPSDIAASLWLEAALGILGGEPCPASDSSPGTDLRKRRSSRPLGERLPSPPSCADSTHSTWRAETRPPKGLYSAR